jgi:hypothetical protein
LPDRPTDWQFEPYQSREKSPPHLGVNIARLSAITIVNTKVHAMETRSSALRAIDAMRVNQRAMSPVTTALATGDLARTKVSEAASSIELKQAHDNQKASVGMVLANGRLFSGSSSN